MSNANKAAAVTPPVLGENTWGIDASDVSSSLAIEMPSSWHNAIITLEADGEDFYVALADDTSDSVAASSASTITSNAFSAQGTAAVKVSDGGSPKDWDLTQVDTRKHKYLVVIGASGTSGNILRITRSSGQV